MPGSGPWLSFTYPSTLPFCPKETAASKVKIKKEIDLIFMV
jgi:hypothetical protein